MKIDKKITAVILAAGSGTRLGATKSKQLIEIASETVIHRSVRAFAECDIITDIVVVHKSDEYELIRDDLSDIKNKRITLVEGGKSRAESARLGFLAVSADTDFVAIHDAARCMVTPDMIRMVAREALEHGAATAAAPLADTLKRATDDGYIKETLPRQNLYRAQTPQIFARSLYQRMLECNSTDVEITDDNIMAEMIGAHVRIVDTGAENFKITTADDLAFAEYKLGKRENMESFRIGHGYDVHRFSEGRALILGGVDIPYEKGLLGHSDADVLTHAIMDALLGAASLGDIGRHFPDTSDEFRGISSLLLLERVRDLIAEQGYLVENIDATLVIQSPKISPHIPKIISNLSSALDIPPENINVKATTEERLGFTGSGEGAAAHAVAMLRRKRG